MIRLSDGNLGILSDCGACLVCANTVDVNDACKDEGLSPLARRCEAASHEKLI